MARAETQRLIFGGMQLGAPADKLPEGDSLIIQNFSSDKNNQLVSRKGSVKECGPIGSGRFHTLVRTGVNVYAGIGTELYHGPALGSQVATGFDGEPLGFAAYRGAAWFMNRNKRVRVVGAEANAWGVEAPSNAPTATGGGQVTQTLNDFTSGSTVLMGVVPVDGDDPIYAMQAGTPVDNEYAEANFEGEGGTLKVKVLSAQSLSCYTEAGGSLIAGTERDDDIIRVRVFCSNPRALESATVFAKSGSGYVEFAITDPAKFLNQAMDSWTEIKIRRRLNLDDYTQRITKATSDGNQQTISDIGSQLAVEIQTPTFVYTGAGWPQTGIGGVPPANFPPSQAMLDMAWSSISKFGVSFKTKEAVIVGIGKAEAVGTVGENSSGAITYWYSYLNVFGEDGNPSPPSNPVIAGNQTITVGGMAPSADPRVISKFIWRSGGGLTQAYKVAVVGNDVTSWEDRTTNRDAQSANSIMPINRDLPPAARGVIGPIYGKLIAYNSDLHPARYWWSPTGRPWCFFGAEDEEVGDWDDAGSDDDPIVVHTDHRPVMVIYKQRSIWKVVGDPATSSAIESNAHVGVFGPKAVCKKGGVDFIVGTEGVYVFNMDSLEKLSRDIDPIFKGEYVQLYDGVTLPPLSYDHQAKTCIESIGDRLRVSYVEHGYSEPNVVLLYDIPSGRWYRETYTSLPKPAFSAMMNEGFGGGRGFLGGMEGGYLYRLETYGFYLDDNQSARGVWQSRFFHQGLPHNNKVYLDLEVDCSTRFGPGPNSPLSVSIIYDDGTIVALGTISSADAIKPRFKHVFRLMNTEGTEVGRTAKNYAVRIECDILGIVSIYGIVMHWYPEEREARSFDTGPTNHGTEQAKQIDHVEWFMTASGQALKRNIHSDLPGNLLVVRDSTNFAAPNGRGTERKRIDVIEGRNFRYTLSDSPSGSKFQVHQGRVRMRTIGEYLDGSKGEYFESGEFSIAPGRVGELKDLLFDYDTASAGGRIEIYTDLPTHVMELRRTLSIPVRDRAPFVFAFEDPTLAGPSDSITALPEGQLFKVRFYPPPGGVLRCHGRAMFRARLIGVYFDGSTGEIWETQVLDLLNGHGLFREVSIITETAGPMTLEISTELPNGRMGVAARVPVDTSASGRMTTNARLPGNTKGRLQQFRLVGPYVGRVLGCKILARRTEVNPSSWDWVQVPLEATSNSWAEINVPMRQTSETFSWVELPVDSIE